MKRIFTILCALAIVMAGAHRIVKMRFSLTLRRPSLKMFSYVTAPYAGVALLIRFIICWAFSPSNSLNKGPSVIVGVASAWGDAFGSVAVGISTTPKVPPLS